MYNSLHSRYTGSTCRAALLIVDTGDICQLLPARSADLGASVWRWTDLRAVRFLAAIVARQQGRAGLRLSGIALRLCRHLSFRQPPAGQVNPESFPVSPVGIQCAPSVVPLLRSAARIGFQCGKDEFGVKVSGWIVKVEVLNGWGGEGERNIIFGI